MFTCTFDSISGDVTEYTVGERFKRNQSSFPISLVTRKYPLRLITSSEKKIIEEMTSKWIGDVSIPVKNDVIKRWFYERKGIISYDTQRKMDFGQGTEGLHRTLRQGYDIWMADKTKDIAIVDGSIGYHKGWSFNFTCMKMIPPGANPSSTTCYDISYTDTNIDFDKEFPLQKEITILSEPNESLLKPMDLGYTETSLSPLCVEYEFLLDFFKRHQTSNQYKINGIKKISHTVQARKYHFQRTLMSAPRELLLFHHSSSNDTVRLANSLDMRNPQSITTVGKAIYLSDNVEFTHRHSKNPKRLYLVKCLIGDPDNQETNPRSVVHPPVGFDSVMFKSNKTNVFAVYSNDQCYISYVLDISTPNWINWNDEDNE